MQIKYSPSVNILRDANRQLDYIPTPNSYNIVNQISNDYKKGYRSFNLIGSFGTGKSSFLWALQQSFLTENKIFRLNLIDDAKVSVIPLVGEYKSLIQSFADYFDVKGSDQNEILSEIFNSYYDLKSDNGLLVIIIDEFGKFLEYAAENAAEKELYFVQQIAELANNTDHNILFLTSLHQNFEAYSYTASSASRNEWTKVKGRFKELAFNEPIEQLLYLAAQHNKEHKTDFDFKVIKKALSIALKTKAFLTKPDFIEEVAESLYPMDILSAIGVTVALQRYGQNERSLFSFLQATDYTSIKSELWKRDNPFYNIACVYDYLLYSLYSFIHSKYNPDHNAWSVIKSTLEEAERIFDKDVNIYHKIIKTVGLLNIFSVGGAILDRVFLLDYCKVCLGIPRPELFISNLETKQLIYFRKYNKRFILFEGTDLDIASALIKAGKDLSEINDLPALLNKYYQLPLVFAKRYSFLNGTPRFFEYKITDYPVNDVPQAEVDGFINLVFNEKISLEDVVGVSANQEEAILYGYYKNSKAIKDLLFEIEKTKQVIQEQEIANDKIAIRELNNILEHQQNLLNHKILDSFYSDRNEVVWIYNGLINPLHSKRQFNNLLSQICTRVYPNAPRLYNELVNKHKISASIHTAKRNYLKALVINWDKPGLGFPADKYPPQKTIYLSLLENNGIRLYTDDINRELQVNNQNNFLPLWELSNNFINSARLNRKRISDFVELLTIRPFKLKQGLIDIWAPTFLFLKRDEFALFGENGYIPFITDETLELIVKNPFGYEIKAFAIEGVKLDIFNSYRILLQQDAKASLSNNNFIETIKPFITFYNGLPNYTKRTKRLSKEALLIRDAIIKAKDPEQTFFEDFPSALGYSEQRLHTSSADLQQYIIRLQEAIRELRGCYDELIVRIEGFLQNDIIGKKLSFEEYQAALQLRYKNLKKHLLLPYQKMFVDRLNSEINDRKAWLNSLALVLISTSLDSMQDEMEFEFMEKFKDMILNLDSLTELSNSDISENTEEVIGVQITSFLEGVNKKLVRLPKSKKVEVETVKNKLQKMLSADRTINIAALTTVLNELFKK